MRLLSTDRGEIPFLPLFISPVDALVFGVLSVDRKCTDRPAGDREKRFQVPRLPFRGSRADQPPPAGSKGGREGCFQTDRRL